MVNWKVTGAARAFPARSLIPVDSVPVTVVDVDSDPELTRRYGLKVPVLLLDGSVICHYTLNSQELLRLVGRAAAILPR